MRRPCPRLPARAVRPRRWMYCSRLEGSPICKRGEARVQNVRGAHRKTISRLPSLLRRRYCCRAGCWLHRGAAHNTTGQAAPKPACTTSKPTAPHLQHQRDVGVVDAARRYVGAEQDGLPRRPERSRRLLAGRLQKGAQRVAQHPTHSVEHFRQVRLLNGNTRGQAVEATGVRRACLASQPPSLFSPLQPAPDLSPPATCGCGSPAPGCRRRWPAPPCTA